MNINRLKRQLNTGFVDAIQTGICTINGVLVALCVMESSIIRGSMGVVVGYKMSEMIEYASKHKLPFIIIIVSASGGARVQEGIYGLMQMAKISSLLSLSYRGTVDNFFSISFIATPTMGGVLASFAMLGDIRMSETGVTIGFAGKDFI